MKLSRKLWESNIEIAKQSLNTNFVQGIKSGELPKNKFQSYIAQDYYFLMCFARSYGLAISKSNDINSIKILSGLLMGVSEELILHESYAKKWECNLSLNKIKPATKQYTDFLDEVSKKFNMIEIMVAMSPCMSLYSWIGKNLAKSNIDNTYKEWVITYSDESFSNLAKALEDLIDIQSEAYNFKLLNKIYEKAMELELNFFEEYSDF
tara:strand:+ start:7113 stop:7736 length:624 start_codon:yes stop_codon:yes gene_type:complete